MKADEIEHAGLALRPVRNNEEGFTLIETSIALVVMMIVGLGAASLFSFAMSNNLRGSDRMLSMAVAQDQMEQLRKTSFTNLATRITQLGGADRTLTRDGRQFRVVTSMADTVSGNASLKTVTVRVARLGPKSPGLTPAIVTMRATDSLGPNLIP